MSGISVRHDFDVPRDRVVPVTGADIVRDPGPHPYEREFLAAIEADWTTQLSANPSLFDGQVCLMSALSLRPDGMLNGHCHMVRFATFLHWRKNRPVAGAEHLFAHAMPISSDGALIAIRMAANTANPRRVYFAAGSFDGNDFDQRALNVEANMRREVREETGLDLADARQERGYGLYSQDSLTVIAKRYRFNETADTLAGAIDRHIATDPDPEIEEPVIIRQGAALPAGLMPHMPHLIDWHFTNPVHASS